MAVDLTARVGSVTLANPVMTAAGTAGHGDELAAYLDVARLGAMVVKSLAPFEWAGNPSPRVHAVAAGMLNSVGLQGPGVERWLSEELPALLKRRARVVASIWGRTVDDYHQAAKMLAGADGVLAVEVNLSCPNLEGGKHLFAHDPLATSEAVEATEVCGLPRWAKLSPNTSELVTIAGSARDAGAEAVTLVNTMLGLALDVETGRPVLGAGGGGLSGRAIHPIAVRAVFEVRQAHPDLPILGVGGISSGVDAVEFLLAGANAVQVGTATFADPRACERVLTELQEWCDDHGVKAVSELVGGRHEPTA